MFMFSTPHLQFNFYNRNGLNTIKTQEPVIFYNPNVPLQFSTSLVNTLEKKADQTNEKIEARQVEFVVRERVAQELEKIKETESKLKEKFYVELTEQNAEKDNLNAVATNTDIQTMIERISRSSPKELPVEVQKCQEAVVACYNKNKDRSLDCWKEVVDFKQAVTEEQKKFVAAHQN
ncbi:unnamed protein product [Mucor hiemalis]